MSGHRHNPNADTQNQGNSLGDRSSVRQSRLYRIHESGNAMKGILGSSHLSWDSDRQQGAYEGRPVYDHARDGSYGGSSAHRSEGRRDKSRAQEDSYSGHSYQTTSSGYGHSSTKSQGMSHVPSHAYDENFVNNADPRRRSNGQAPYACDDDYQSGGRGYGRGHADSGAGAASSGYAAVKGQFARDSGSYRRQQDSQPYAVAATTSHRRGSFGQQTQSTRPW